LCPGGVGGIGVRFASPEREQRAVGAESERRRVGAFGGGGLVEEVVEQPGVDFEFVV
jgi:hypothetical protein